MFACPTRIASVGMNLTEMKPVGPQGLDVKPRNSAGSPTRSGPLPQIMLVQGAERALVDRVMRRYKAAVLAQAPEAELMTISARDYAKGEIATLVSSSLFAEERLLTVEDLEQLNDDFADDFVDYLRGPLPEVWVLLRHAGGTTRGQRVINAIKKSGFGFEKCEPVKNDGEKARLVADEVRAAGGRIDQHAASALVSAIRGDLTELLAAARQLVNDSAGNVTGEQVHEFFRGRVETKPYEVSDAVAAGDGPRALLLARQAFSTGIDPVVIVAALAATFRGMAKAKVSGIPAREIAPQPWQADKARQASRRWSEELLGRAITLIAEADSAVKGLSRAPEGSVELCILEMTQSFNRITSS